MVFNKEKTCAFNGPRPYQFHFAFTENSKEISTLKEDIEEAIVDAAKMGFDTFLCGMASGFDMLCAEALLDLCGRYYECKGLKLIAVIPFKGHMDYWDKLWQIKYDRLNKLAYKTVFTSDQYSRECYFIRNRFIIDHASRLICCCDEKSEAYTVSYAKQKSLSIVNLYKRLTQPTVI